MSIKAVRMFDADENQMLTLVKSSNPETVSAILVKDIDYTKKGEKIVVKAGTHIIVDLNRGCALINVDHVVIFGDEYQIKQ